MLDGFAIYYQADAAMFYADVLPRDIYSLLPSLLKLIPFSGLFYIGKYSPYT